VQCAVHPKMMIRRRSLTVSRMSSKYKQESPTWLFSINHCCYRIYDLVARLLDIPQERRAHHNGTEGFWDTYLA
jgi:hypothetical protein